jgi:general secretion pathway protein F
MPTENHKPLAYQVRADLFNGLAVMEKSGLPALQAFELVRLPGAARARVEQMRKLLGRGMDIASAGAKSGLFTSFEARLLRAATQAGSPGASYQRLANRYTEQATQLAAFKSRLMLPGLIFVIALCVQPLPSLVAGTLSTAAYVWQVLRPLLLIASLFWLVPWLKTHFEQARATPTQISLSHWLTRLPLSGAMLVRRNNRDFFSSLALLLEAGVPMFDALPTAVETIGNSAIRADHARFKPRMVQGASLAQALAKSRYLGNAQVLGYIQTGESSGTLPEMLHRFAQAEGDAVSRHQQQLAEWLPRVIYALLALWMAYGILTSGAFMPHLPEELR